MNELKAQKMHPTSKPLQTDSHNLI